MDIDQLVQSIESLGTDDAFRSRLSLAQWRTLARYLIVHSLRPGETLIRQGEASRSLFFVHSGSLHVYVSDAAPGSFRIALLRPGSVVGEAGLFVDAPHMANVEALVPTTVWALHLPRFEELVQRMPSIALEVMRAAGGVMATRLRSAKLEQLAVA